MKLPVAAGAEAIHDPVGEAGAAVSAQACGLLPISQYALQYYNRVAYHDYEGIALDSGFRALHKTHGRRRFRAAGDLPVADEADAGVLTLHHPVLLEDAAAIDEIVAALDKIQHHATMIVQRQTRNA